MRHPFAPDSFVPMMNQPSYLPNSSRKVAHITGVTGQDGAYQDELLLKKGSESYGTYGPVRETPQMENTQFYACSPYAGAKLFDYRVTVNYREANGICACNGVLLNHESPQRCETFDTRKTARAISRIALGLQDCLYQCDMSALRDRGHASNYAETQWLMPLKATP
jgi:GDP-mannose 4,6-dehydratase